MHQERFPPGRSSPRAAFQVDRRFHVHEGQRDKFGETAGIGLQISDAKKMPGPMTIMIDMTEHDGGRALETDMMRGEADWSALRASALARHADHFSDAAMAAGVARVYDEVLGAVQP